MCIVEGMIDIHRAAHPPVIEINGKKYESIAPKIQLEVCEDGSRIIRMKTLEELKDDNNTL